MYTEKMDLYWPTMYDNICEYVVEICKVNKHHTMIMLQYWYWLIGPKLVRPEPYPNCVSSKLCEFFGKCTNVLERPPYCFTKRVLDVGPGPHVGEIHF